MATFSIVLKILATCIFLSDIFSVSYNFANPNSVLWGFLVQIQGHFSFVQFSLQAVLVLPDNNSENANISVEFQQFLALTFIEYIPDHSVLLEQGIFAYSDYMINISLNMITESHLFHNGEFLTVGWGA